MWSWLSSLGSDLSTAYDYTKTAANYVADHATGIGTLLAGGATLYSAFNQPKSPSLPAPPAMPAMPTMSDITSDASKLVNQGGKDNLSADYKSILAKGTQVADKFKLDTKKAVSASSGLEQKRKASIRADINTTKSVWGSYAPIKYHSLLGGS